MSHLSDTQLQDLLDDNLNARQTHVYLGHIRECPQCRQEWNHYRRLWQNLKTDPGMPLSGEFTENVLASLPDLLRHRRIRQWMIAAGSFMILAGTGLCWCFRAAIKQFLLSRAEFETTSMQFRLAFQEIGDFILRIGGNQMVFFGLACLALILIGIVDRKFIQPRTNQPFQFQNGIS